MKVGVIGTGYVGSVTGACLAEVGHDVTLVDVIPEKVEMINSGQAPIEEKGLEEIISSSVEGGNLRATLDLGKTVAQSDVLLLCLPTPPNSDGSSNLDFVFNAAKEIGDSLKPETIVATRSTVPVGTTHRVGQLLTERAGFSALVASNPEFLAEGTAVHDTQHPTRIVIGTDFRNEVEPRFRELYSGFVLDNVNKVILMDPVSAEMSKLFANGILSADITFSNVVAEICERVGADYRLVRQGASFDPRIGRFTQAGPGFGGSCFPKDIRNLGAIAREVGVDSTFLDEITEVNERMKARLADKVREFFGEEGVKGKNIGVLGLSFKPDTDDMRESPAVDLISSLTAEGAHITAFDPKAMDVARQEFAGNEAVTFAADKYEAARDADVLVIVTDWGIFKNMDEEHLADIMRSKAVIDGRSILSVDKMRAAGFYYDSVGRALVGGVDV